MDRYYIRLKTAHVLGGRRFEISLFEYDTRAHPYRFRCYAHDGALLVEGTANSISAARAAAHDLAKSRHSPVSVRVYSRQQGGVKLETYKHRK